MPMVEILCVEQPNSNRDILKIFVKLGLKSRTAWNFWVQEKLLFDSLLQYNHNVLPGLDNNSEFCTET